MKIAFHFQPETPEAALWAGDLARLLPGTAVACWKPGDPPADYAVVWHPSGSFIAAQPRLKAMFNAGAGVDALLKPGLRIDCPLIRLEDAGMAVQMCEYVAQAVLDHVREFDRYASQQQAARWAPRPLRDKADFPVGVLGLGVLGQRVAGDLRARGFPVHAWTRTARDDENGIRCFHGAQGLAPFLSETRIVVCLLPLTPETEGILDRANLRRLRRGAYVINVARGGHVVDQDLIEAIDEGWIAGATLDVFREEPLPATHPFWRHPAIRVTPHIAAATLRTQSVRQIAAKIRRIEAGLPVSGVVDVRRGY